MGIFHLLCPASGLPLVTEDVVLVLVARSKAGTYSPVAPPIRGAYDSYGGLETYGKGPIESAILNGGKKLATVDTIDDFLSEVQDGEVGRLGYVLFLAGVFDAIAAETKGKPSIALSEDRFCADDKESKAALTELAKFTAGFEGSWKPPREGDQYDASAIRKRVEKALATFAARPKVLAAIRKYAKAYSPKPKKKAAASAS